MRVSGLVRWTAVCAALGLACSSGTKVDGDEGDPSGSGAGKTGGSGSPDAGGSSVEPGAPDAGDSTTGEGTPDAGDVTRNEPDAGTPRGWPTCDEAEPGATRASLHEIWGENPPHSTEHWIPGVFVTAISKGACTAGTSCQFFVQQQETFPDLASGSQQGLRVFVAAEAATHFTGLAVGDKVDMDAFAWRDTSNGRNDLHLHVDLTHPGCAKKVGTGNLVPVPVELTDLTVDGYENTMGPLLVTLAPVSGKPAQPTETFALWKTGTFSNADPTTLTSLSPYYLPDATFNGLTAAKTHDFTQVTGVFGLFLSPTTPPVKYEEIYVRSDADYPVAKVH